LRLARRSCSCGTIILKVFAMRCAFPQRKPPE
jgi:hypothetical protein